MKKLFLITLAISFVYVGCDLIDGTGVTNPNLTLEESTASANSASAWLVGTERRAALLMNSFLTTAEITTDNVENKNTFFNQNVNSGIIRKIDTDIENTNFAFARLREQAKYGLEVVIAENDTDAAGTEIEAEFHFYLGYAHLLAAENMTSLPAEPEGVPQSPETHFQVAIDAFTAANAVVADPSYDLALARAHYGLGNKTEAVSFAEDFLASAPADFVRNIEFDGVNGPSSTIQLAVYDRQTFNDLQPLPRLDFLDPKYGDLPGVQQSPIAILKAEEAHLIIAEAQLSDDNLVGAVSTMSDIVDLVSSRPTRDFNETNENRIGNEGVNPQRPNTSDFIVRSDANSPFLPGLVLDRVEETTVPTISGTSVTEQDILDVATDNTELLRLVYLMRQEIFFLEGRRMFDLGIRWPVSEVEELNNENVTEADLQPVIPSHIPSPYVSMNEFDADFDTNEVTILIDMNRVIAEERGNRFD